MKRLAILLLALVLLCMPVLACAETIDLSPIGITIEMPESWFCGTVWQGTDSELSQIFDLNEESLALIMNEQNMCCMTALPDATATSQLQVVSTEGSLLVDMRNITASMWEPFYEGFMNSFTFEVTEGGRFDGENCAFVRVFFETQGVHAVQYTTNVNGIVYILQFASYNGPIKESIKTELDAIASSMTFLD